MHMFVESNRHNIMWNEPTNLSQEQFNMREVLRIGLKRFGSVQEPITKLYNYKILEEILHLNEGQAFGELALIKPNSKRSATCRTLEDTHLGVLNR